VRKSHLIYLRQLQMKLLPRTFQFIFKPSSVY